MTAAKRTLMTALVGAVGYLLPLVIMGNYRHNIMAQLATYVISVIGFNLLLGLAGQFSMAHGAFMSIGGYTTAYLSLKMGLPTELTVLLAGLVSAAVGALLGFVALRLSGAYLALITMVFALALPQAAIKWEQVTGGPLGLSPAKFVTDRLAYWVILTYAIVLAWIALNIRHTRPGRALLALKESEVAAQAMGVDLALVKTGAFALSSFYAGVAGALMVHLVGYIGPADFGLAVTFQILAITVVGGMGSIPGAVIGTIVVMMISFLLSRVAGWATIVEGAVILLVVRFFPGGLADLVTNKIRLGVRS